jgi:hypothetical protein
MPFAGYKMSGNRMESRKRRIRALVSVDAAIRSTKSQMQSGIRGIWTETPRFETGDTR